MVWHASLDRLVQLLAALYDTEGQARIPAKGAGLDLTRIAFNGSPQVFWDAIITEAQKQDKVLALIDRVRADFPSDTDLQQARADYLTWQQEAAAAPVAPAPAVPRIYQLTPQQKRQLVDALANCPTMQDQAARDAVVEYLRSDIKNNVRRHSALRLDVNSIVSTALFYAGGLEELIEAVRDNERASAPMAEVDRVIASFG